MMTRDVAFTENMYNHMQTQMKRSTLISEVSEKESPAFSGLSAKEFKNGRKH
jgi:hypothetical protein